MTKKQSKFLFGILISLICLGFMFKQINIYELKKAFNLFNWNYLLGVMCCLFLGYSLRIYRWTILLCSMNAEVSFKNCQAPFLGSIALNNVLPLRMGDIFRAIIFPNYLGISISNSTSSVIFERLIDLLSLIVFVSIGFMFQSNFQNSNWIIKSTCLLGGFALLVFLIIYRFNENLIHIVEKLRQIYAQYKIANKLLEFSIEIIRSLAKGCNSQFFKKILLYSFLIWLFEAGIFYFLLLGFNLKINPGFALVVMSIVTISTLVPSSPGYIGPFHLAAYAIISMLGVTNSVAAGFALLAHLCLWGPTTLVGLGFIAVNPNLFRIMFNKKNMDISYEKV